MSSRWSNEQLAAINVDLGNTLVSASAGSGKTSVLSERVLRLVKSGTPISKFLILTFTNLAANEMKNRIRTNLAKDEKTFLESLSVDNAHIETYDAFLLFLVKKYSYVLKLDSNVSIIDDNLLTIFTNKAIDSVLDKYYLSKDQTFVSLVNYLDIKNDDKLIDNIKNILSYPSKQMDPSNFLNHGLDILSDDGYIDKLLEETVFVFKSTVNDYLSYLDDFMDSDDASRVEEYLNSILNCSSYDELYTFIISTSFPKKPKNGMDEESRTLIKEKVVKFLKESLKKLGDRKAAHDLYKENLPYYKKMFEIASEVYTSITNFKHGINAYTYDDIALMALKLLSIPSINKEIKSLFKYIIVDEYQDTSPLQEEVLSKIGNDNLFMVGDVKQSIYAFRGADCQIFLNKSISYHNEEGGRRIDMNTSYRSRKEVVDSINDLFSRYMTTTNNPIDYSKGHHFNFGLQTYESNREENASYGLSIYRYDKDPKLIVEEQEASIIASDIIDKINSGYRVFDKKLNHLRPCTFSDFAILIETKKNFKIIKRIFETNNIPLVVNEDDSFSDNDSFYVIKNLVKCFYYISIDEMGDEFIHSFVSLLRSFLINETDENIYHILTKNSYKETDLYKMLSSLIPTLIHESLYHILFGLLKSFNLYSRLITIGDILENNNRINLFLKTTQNLDDLGYTLSDFVTYLDDIDTSKLSIKIKQKEVKTNSVNLMSIHKSKGLEFPIIYFPYFYHQFNFNKEGLHNECFYPKINIKKDRNTVGEFLFAKKYDRSIIEEKIRLLYVALTRAKESSIILYQNRTKTYNFKTLYPSKSYQDFIDYYINRGPLNLIDYVDKHPKLTENIQQFPIKNIEIRSITTKISELEILRASKDASVDVSDSLLSLGRNLHSALEFVNFKTKDLSFIKDIRIKKLVSNIVSLPLFDDQNNKYIHEYSFHTSEGGISGYIDLLIVKEEEIDIIDFKLKHIEDEAYLKQLKVYKDYISSISNGRLVKCYLISAFEGRFEEIKV